MGTATIFEQRDLIVRAALERAEVPAGAVSILNGIGSELGARLVESSAVDQIVFTGSVPTGQAILRAAANPVTPALMELGGKSAAVAFEDANLDTLMSSLQSGIFYNAGQVCSAMSRVLVHRSIYEEAVERAAALANGLSVGHGLEQGTHVLCHGCRRPIRPEDRDRPEYERGVSCHLCFDETSESDKARFRERQRQLDLARARGEAAAFPDGGLVGEG